MTEKQQGTEEKQVLDFRYVELIRKPQLEQESEKSDAKGSGAGGIICVALDYFDVIYAKKVKNLEECMVSENDIPCEAYQSLGLFREVDEDENAISGIMKDEGAIVEEDPFLVDQKRPFFAIMQVTVTPEVYKYAGGGGEKEGFDLKPLEEELRGIVSETWEFIKTKALFERKKSLETNQYSENNSYKLELNYQIYRTLNTMDFCIVLSCNRMDFPARLSARIKAEVCGSAENACPKYAVYTVMGIFPEFFYNKKQEEKQAYMHSDTILVARILLDRKVYVEQQRLKEFKDILGEEKDKEYISTHNLPGRYELSVRIDGADNILGIISDLLTYIMNSFTLVEESTDKAGKKPLPENHFSSENKPENVLRWVMRTQSARYLNIRIFFNSPDCFSFEPESDHQLSGDIRLPDSGMEIMYGDLRAYAACVGFGRRMKDYFDKLHLLIHTYVTLYPQYDTNLNIKMLGECLICFMKLLKLHIGFVLSKKENMEDVEKNVLWALNYFQQYVRVVSSVNSNSFQAPQYEIEKDECSIVKLPIAYMQFLQEMFQKYYSARKENGDDEFGYFPKYVPLVIPYMQNSSQDSDFMMLTLFGQNMADKWEKVQKEWQEYIQDDNGVLMFIICQDMMKYKSASELIVSTFHEMGHYCNGLTRKERNLDLIMVLSEEIAKAMTRRAVAYSEVSYDQKVAAIMTSSAIARLYQCIYREVCDHFTTELSGYIQYPKGVFLERLWNSLRELTNEFADCGNPQLFCEQFLEDDFDEIAFCFGDPLNADKQAEAVRCLKQNFDKAVREINACSSAMGDNAEFREMVNKYVSCSSKLMRDAIKNIMKNVQKTESGDNKPYERAEIKEMTKSMIKCANGIAGQVQKYKEEDVKKLRQSLKVSKQVLELCLKFSNHTAFWKAAENSKQSVENSCLKEYAEKRGKMLDRIWKNYMENVSAVTADASLPFLELFSQMHITEKSSGEGFKTYMNRVISGLSVPEDVLELAKSNYEESIADIVMCVNLGLGVREYMAFVSGMYEKDDNKFEQSAPRFVIVIAYLMYGEEWNASQNEKNKLYEAKEVSVIEDKFLEKIDQSFIEDLWAQMGDLDDLTGQACKKLCEKLQKQFTDVKKSKLFRTALERALGLGSKVNFIGKEDDYGEIRKFVKDSLCEKGNQDSNKQKIQYDEIRFIQKYYYKNRVQYAKKTIIRK